ncbi:MAG TPA: NAD(P)-dependent oxidoreductase [Candidatus Sulfotelmatobacter sp.]|nr:NAD(P)-dependent oxidoreductase [Candidatus Sulfotelmatobacter sp.]
MNLHQKRSILVTGGAGFIGRAVVKHLVRSGCRVVALDRIEGVAAEGFEGYQTIQCNLADLDQLRRVFHQQRFAGIIHLAAILPTAAQRNPKMATQVNVQGSVNVLEMARQFHVPRVVYGSSLSIYGTYLADRTVSEADRAAPEDLYGAAKLYIEQLGRAYRECHGVDFVSLRIGRVVGPGAQSVTSAWRSEIFELLKASYPAEIRLPYAASEKILVLHVEDLAMMLEILLKAERTEHAIYNAPCRSILVGDLKHAAQDLNSHLTVTLGDAKPIGNPQVIDFTRFQKEFNFEGVSIFDRLRRAAAK